MTDRLIVDLDEGGTVRVSPAWDGELPPAGDEAALSWPLDRDALEDLRWYLEDYLIAPFGVYEDRGARVQGELPSWGQSVFSSVFGSGPARDAYVKMRARGDVELVFRSASPGLLGLPWELMADPGRSLPLALEVAGVSRSLPAETDAAETDAAETVPVPGGRLRVLMVISRPAGKGDVGYRMVARPLLDRLETVRGAIDLVVLRPPTLDALRTELAAAVTAGTPYQVVHFGGHGAMPGGPAAASSPLTLAGNGGEGVLVFEKPGGGADQVPASRVAQVLADAKVPVVVLNACQPAAVGQELAAAVAARLLGEGIASVIAMAYSVYAVAAAEFMATFYEKLFAGGTVASAVTAGRQQLFRNPGRPSPKGELPLADWLVPVHYFRREVRFPRAVVPRPAGLPSLAEALAAVAVASAEAGLGDLGAVDGVFAGRDALFYDLEVAARLRKVVVLAGPGGTGKTELAKAFGRWWRDTGGIENPGWVFWHSFEPGGATFSLDGVIDEIGLGLFGTDFALLEAAQRRAVVRVALAEHRMLLIWDNFESVRTMADPDHATPPLDDAGCDELREFLADLAARGKSAVLITSRTPEDWLGEIRRIAVGGLATHEATEYAEALLAPYPAARGRREGHGFGDLMQWLDGHPLSMRLILPRLDTTDPDALLASLPGSAPLPSKGNGERDQAKALAASVAYSCARLSEATRRLLPAVSLLHGVADADALSSFSQAPHVPDRFAGATKGDWVAALDDAARAGLLTSLGSALYGIRPALPGYLAAVWRSEEPDDHGAIRDVATRAMLVAQADRGDWLLRQIRSGDAELAHAIIGLERRTLGSLLSYALSQGLYGQAQSIIAPLGAYWDARGLDAEADTWTDRARQAAESPAGTPPQPDTPPGGLWKFATDSQANRKQRHHQFDDAEAEEWCRKALALTEEIGDRRGLAMSYHQLGMVAQVRGLLSEAEEWYLKALALTEEIGDRRGLAMSYHQLGTVAQDRELLGEAEEWYRKALALEEEVSNRPHMARTLHQLGMAAQDRGLLGEAEEWYRKALALEEEVGDRPGLASTYHQLGMVAQDRRLLREAQEWYRKALALKEELDNQPGMALTHAQLGLLAEGRGRLPEALACAVRCVSLFSEVPHPLTGTGPWDLARYTGALGLPALEGAWHAVTGDELPRNVRDYVEEQLREVEEQLREGDSIEE